MRVNRAHWPTRENKQQLLIFCMFPAHAKNCLGWPQVGPGRSFSGESRPCRHFRQNGFDRPPRVCALRPHSFLIHGQLAGACTSWEPSVQLHWRLRLPCLTDARVLFSSLSAPPSIALVLAPLALLECRQAMLLSLPQPPLCVGIFPLAPHFLHKWVSQSLRLSSWRSFIPCTLLF